MRTKYVLHGCGAQHQNAENDAFFGEILKDTPKSPKVLLVHFAGGSERAEINDQRDRSQFERVKGNKMITYEVASEDAFLDQAKRADVIYVGGGTTVRLLDVLKEFDLAELREAFEGKIVAGESAGMNFLAEYCYSKSGRGVIKCLGIIPFKTIPHYSEKYKEGMEELEKIRPDLKTMALAEHEYFVYEERR